MNGFACSTLLVVSCFLLGLNFFGLTQSLENPELHADTSSAFVRDKTLSYAQFLHEYERWPEESVKSYVPRLSRLVNQSISHLWHTKAARQIYHAHVPAWENYWLFLLGMKDSERFAEYEFIDWHKAIERGIGLCSQHAFVVIAILSEQGIPARLVNLTGHVLVEVQVDKLQWWVVDADFGVVIPYDLRAVERSPRVVRQHYADAVLQCRPSFPACTQMDSLVNYFSSTHDNRRSQVGASFYPRAYWLEKSLYLLKWLFPLLLLVLRWVLMWVIHMRQNARPVRNRLFTWNAGG